MLSTNELIRLMTSGVMTPDAALGEYQSQADAQRQRRIKRRDAMEKAEASSLGEIGTLATTEAQQGTTLDQLASLASSKLGQSITPEQLYSVPGVSDVYLPMGQEGFTGNAGQSRINPTLPSDVAAAIQSDLMKGEETPDSILRKLQERFGPKTFSRLLPEISTIVDRSMKRSTSWGGGS